MSVEGSKGDIGRRARALTRLTSLICPFGLAPNQVEVAHSRYTFVIGDLSIESS